MTIYNIFKTLHLIIIERDVSASLFKKFVSIIAVVSTKSQRWYTLPTYRDIKDILNACLLSS